MILQTSPWIWSFDPDRILFIPEENDKHNIPAWKPYLAYSYNHACPQTSEHPCLPLWRLVFLLAEIAGVEMEVKYVKWRYPLD